MLFPVTKDGQTRAATGHCGKNGNYYILDRTTGQPICGVTEMPVPTSPSWQHPWPTQPVSAVAPLTPLTVLFHPPGNLTVAPQYAPPHEEEVLIQPGDDGGCEWPPAAFSPRTGFVYYGTRYEPTLFSSFRTAGCGRYRFLRRGQRPVSCRRRPNRRRALDLQWLGRDTHGQRERSAGGLCFRGREFIVNAFGGKSCRPQEFPAEPGRRCNHRILFAECVPLTDGRSASCQGARMGPRAQRAGTNSTETGEGAWSF